MWEVKKLREDFQESLKGNRDIDKGRDLSLDYFELISIPLLIQTLDTELVDYPLADLGWQYIGLYVFLGIFLGATPGSEKQLPIRLDLLLLNISYCTHSKNIWSISHRQALWSWF